MVAQVASGHEPRERRARKKRLLAISGKRFSGKDTFAGLVVEAARAKGVRLQTYAFAAESKRLFVEEKRRAGVAVDLDRLTTDREYKERWRPELTAFTVRSIDADPLVFCRAVADRIEASTDPALVTDLRLKLELAHLRPRFDLHVLRMSRSDENRAASGWTNDPVKDGHHTETELDDPSLWDEVVTNDGSHADLAAKAAAVAARL